MDKKSSVLLNEKIDKSLKERRMKQYLNRKKATPQDKIAEKQM